MKTTTTTILCGLVFLAGFVAGVVVGRVSSEIVVTVEEPVEPVVARMREAVAERSPDEKAEVVSISDAVTFHGVEWRQLRVRTRNAFNAQVWQDFFVVMEGDKPVRFVAAEDRASYPGGTPDENIAWLKKMAEAGTVYEKSRSK